jgi:hemerythrin
MNQSHPAKFEWGDSMSVGVEALDRDHRFLVTLIDRLASMDDLGNAPEVEHVLDDLVRYTEEHFEREEEYMRATDYPDLVRHQRLHEEMVKKIEKLRMQFFLGEKEHIGHQTLDFLIHWLQHHVLGEDMKYSPQRRRGEAHPR